MATRTCKAAGGNWNATGTWEEAAVPTEADDVVFAVGCTGTLTLTELAKCRSYDGTNHAGLLSRGTNSLKVGTSTVNGTLALKWGASETLSGTGNIELLSTSGTQIKLYLAGPTIEGNIILNGAGGNYLLETAINCTAIVNTKAGTFNTNGKEVKATRFLFASESTRTITLGASLLILSFSGSGVIEGTGAGLTFNAGTSTIRCTGAGSGTFMKDESLTYYKLELLGGGTYAFGSGNRTFTHLAGSNASAWTLTYPASAELKIAEGGTVELSGTTGNKLKIASQTAGTTFRLRCKGIAAISNDYVTLKDVECWGGVSWYWGSHSSRESKVFGAIMASKATARSNIRKIGIGWDNASAMDDADYLAINKSIAPRHLDRTFLFNGMDSDLIFSSDVTLARKYGLTLHTAWQVKEEVHGTANTGTLGNVASGVLDTYLLASAEACKAYGEPIEIRLCHEFNGNWHTYGFSHETGASFIEGWRYIVNFFKAHGVTNVKWVWSANSWLNSSAASVGAPQEFYPGDEYVDYVAGDFYMNLEAGFNKQPDFLILQNYIEFQELAPSKPVMISEVGAAIDVRVERKQWIEAFWELIRAQTPNVFAVSWWNRETEGEGNYALEGEPEALGAYAKAVNEVAYTKSGELKYGTRHIYSGGAIHP